MWNLENPRKPYLRKLKSDILRFGDTNCTDFLNRMLTNSHTGLISVNIQRPRISRSVDPNKYRYDLHITGVRLLGFRVRGFRVYGFLGFSGVDILFGYRWRVNQRRSGWDRGGGQTGETEDLWTSQRRRAYVVCPHWSHSWRRVSKPRPHVRLVHPSQGDNANL